MLLGGIDFALILAQLGRDVVELQFRINFLLSFSRYSFLIIKPRQAVFAERVAHLESALAQSDVVGFRSGEILHGSAERFRRQQAHVNLHASAQAEANFIFATRDDLHQAGQLDDVFDQFIALGIVAAGFAGDENIEITDGFASAAQRSGRSNFLHAGKIFQVIDNFLRLALSSVYQEASSDAAVIFNGFEQLGFVLLAHARQNANLALASQFLHAFEIADLVRAPDQSDRLVPEALNFQKIEHGGPILFQQLGMQREPAFFEHLLHVRQHAFADAGDLQDLLRFADQLGNLLWQGFDRLGCIAIRANAKRILAIDFEQIGSFVENSGDGFIIHAELKIKQVGGGRARADHQSALLGTLQLKEAQFVPACLSCEELLGSLVYVCSLWAFLSLDDLELYVITFLKTSITLGGDRAVVHKNIGPFVAPDESVAFRVVKPFHRTFQPFHLRPLGHVLFCTEAVPCIWLQFCC